jgi:hypothetical protein
MALSYSMFLASAYRPGRSTTYICIDLHQPSLEAFRSGADIKQNHVPEKNGLISSIDVDVRTRLLE